MAIYRINRNFPAAPAGGGPPSERVLAVAALFGLGADPDRTVSVGGEVRLEVRPGDVVFLTGPSGTGKSVLLTALVEAMRCDAPPAFLADLAAAGVPPDATILDGLPGDLKSALGVLSAAGLADALAWLRRPAELSDGQRWRLGLAHALAVLAAAPRGRPRVLVADEFASTLDRACARAVAYRVRRLADREGLTVLAATAHDDVAADLAPDVLVRTAPGEAACVTYADPARAAEGGP